MALYLNHRALLQCTHAGQVRLVPPPQRSLQVMGSPVVTDMDLFQAVIVGCTQIGPGCKPCTKIVAIVAGRALQIRTDNETPILDSLQGMTDGMPPGVVRAITNGESNSGPLSPSLQASVLMNAARSGAAFCEACETERVK